MEDEGVCSVHSLGTLLLIGPKLFSTVLPELAATAETGWCAAAGAEVGAELFVGSGCVLQANAGSNAERTKTQLANRPRRAMRYVAFIRLNSLRSQPHG